MSTNLTVTPSEGGIIHITAAFYDESTPPLPITPSEVGVTLTDYYGIVLVARATVTPGETVTVTFSGDDLAKQGDTDDLRRACLFDWTYDSDLGTDLYDQDEARFSIEDLWSVT